MNGHTGMHPWAALAYASGELRKSRNKSRKYLEFQPGFNDYFVGKSHQEVKALMGARVNRAKWDAAPKRLFHGSYAQLPRSFISGQNKWQKCDSTIQYIKDQSSSVAVCFSVKKQRTDVVSGSFESLSSLVGHDR